MVNGNDHRFIYMLEEITDIFLKNIFVENRKNI